MVKRALVIPYTISDSPQLKQTSYLMGAKRRGTDFASLSATERSKYVRCTRRLRLHRSPSGATMPKCRSWSRIVPLALVKRALVIPYAISDSAQLKQTRNGCPRHRLCQLVCVRTLKVRHVYSLRRARPKRRAVLAWRSAARATSCRYKDFKHLRGTSPPTERRAYESAD